MERAERSTPRPSVAPSTALADAAARLDTYAAARIAADGTPGLALAVTDARRTLHVSTFGVADLRSQEAIDTDRLFQIGSMAKSFAAVVALQLADEGLLDLHAPIIEVLPWFDVPSRFAPISLHHLLSHSAGIPSGSLGSIDARSEVWALRRASAAWAPGERYHYSNVGYDAIGLAIARVSGKPYRAVLAERVLEPLGMRHSSPAITAVVRPRLVTPHTPLFTDRPYRRGDPLAPATWFEDDRADGAACSTAEDMTAFLRALVCGGRTPNGVLCSPGAFREMTTTQIATPGGGYGYGIATAGAGASRVIGHAGDMVGYVSHMLADPEAGVAAVALMNGPGSPGAITRYAVEAFGAACRSEPVPPPPDIPDPYVVVDAERYVGEYAGPHELALRAEGSRLWLVVGGDVVALEPTSPGASSFHADHSERWPALGMAPVEVEMLGGRPVALVHGRHRYPARTGPPTPGRNARDAEPDARPEAWPEAWSAFEGLFRTYSPWQPSVRFVRRGGRLWMIDPLVGLGEPLVLVGDATFQVDGDPPSPELIRFARVVDGSALLAEIDGLEHYRSFDEASVWNEGAS